MMVSSSSSQPLNSQAGTGRRPRPRLRDVKSIGPIDHKADGMGKREESPLEKESFLRSPSPAVKGKFKRELSRATTQPDEDDEYFDRARRRNLSVEQRETATQPIGSQNEKEDDMEDDRESVMKLMNYDSNDSTFKPYKRRAYMSKRFRLDSKVNVKRAKRENSLLSTDSQSDVGDADTTITTSPTTEEGGTKLEKDKAVEGSPDASPEPPTMNPDQLREIRALIDRALPVNQGKVLDNDDDLNEVLSSEDFYAQMHPDLRRQVKGAKAPDIRDGLRAARTGIHTEQHKEEKMPSQHASSNLPLEHEQPNESLKHMRTSLPRAERSTSAVKSPSCETIELSDSDDDYRPSKHTASSQAAGSSARRSTRIARRRDSSSPPVFVSHTQANSKATPGTSTSLSHRSSSSGATMEPSPEPSVAAQDAQRSVQAAALRTEEEEAEPERISLIMKAGEGGCIQVPVKVRPTTVVKTLLDHFMDLHRNKVPLERTSKVRIRFEENILKEKDTMASLELEDEDQLDVIW